MDTRYENWTGTHPNGYPEDPKLDRSWHPPPSDLRLAFSHTGEWVRVPRNPNNRSGPNYKDFNIARMEKYVAEDGEMRRAI